MSSASTTTCYPAFTNHFATCEPMKSAPPVANMAYIMILRIWNSYPLEGVWNPSNPSSDNNWRHRLQSSGAIRPWRSISLATNGYHRVRCSTSMQSRLRAGTFPLRFLTCRLYWQNAFNLVSKDAPLLSSNSLIVFSKRFRCEAGSSGANCMRPLRKSIWQALSGTVKGSAITSVRFFKFGLGAAKRKLDQSYANVL